jgi:hypothetical protein
MRQPRIYGAWAGNAGGVKEDERLCITSVRDKRNYISHQCPRKRGHGKDGLYCKQHGEIYEHRTDEGAQ